MKNNSISYTANKFRIEGIARGVSLSTLFEFYTDYSPEDVEIMRKHGQKMALERVSKKEGDHIIVDTTARVMGMTKNMRYNITLHPEDNWYEMLIRIDGFVKSHRTYRFLSVPEGTKIIIDDEYQPISMLTGMLDRFGMLKKRLIGDTTNTMNAFIAEAEERFAMGQTLDKSI
ncbi:MAG: SRPBCC family protein [Thaumarchaeota archaeon]|nr:SRPBCC family protein [Nitrososphaerota archaeon]